MKRFVVAYVDFFDHHMTLEVVEAETEQDARWMHSKTKSGWEPNREETDAMNHDDFQGWCFNSDFLVSVVEV
jgi:hypothetical protein